MSNTVNHHANSFDFLRLVAAWAVLYSHSFVLYGLPLPTPLPGQSYGSLAVAVFFVISGYLITKSWMDDPDAVRFFVKRSLRILPGLWCAVAFCTLVIGPLVTTLPIADYLFHPSTWSYFLNNASLTSSQFDLPGVFEDNPFARAVNASLWTLKYEAIMYGLVALLGTLLSKNKFKWGCLVSALVFSIIWTINIKFEYFQKNIKDSIFIINELGNFGVLFFSGAIYFVFGKNHTKIHIIITICASVLLLFIQKKEIITPLLWITMPSLVIILAKNIKINLSEDISYGVYIYAFPIQQFLIWLLYKTYISWPLMLILSIILTLFFSTLSWILIEKPTIFFKNILLSKN